MLEFSKFILEKVSFDPHLFNKELRKLVLWLGDDDDEIRNLYEWCQDHYPEFIIDKKEMRDSAN